MLPSTGLFKSFACPYYEAGNGVTCQRPYCHFKHVRKVTDDAEAPAAKPRVPEYIPAPKLLTLPQLTIKRKTTLEYQPEKPELDASPAKIPRETSQVPKYIPAPTTASKSTESPIFLTLDDCVEELDELSELIDGQILEEDLSDKTSISSDKRKKVENHAVENKRHRSSDLKKTKHKSSHSSRRDHKEERRDSSSSTSTRHRTKPSSNVEERDNRRENRREKEKCRDKEKERSKDRKSSSSSSRHKSSSKEKLRGSSGSKNSSSSSMSSKHNDVRHSPSSSKPKPSSASKSTDCKSEKDKEQSIGGELQNSKPLSYDFETDKLVAPTAEDIMKECAMIYDQLEQEYAHMKKTEVPKENNAIKRKPSEEAAEEECSFSQKKRVAYENADKVKINLPPTVRKPNHIRNAMQAIFERQRILRRQQEEEAAATAKAVLEAEEKVREANEALRKAKEKNMTPLIPKSFLTPPPRTGRSIAPVANLLALERAKKKVEELKAEKKPAFTPAQTTKVGSRIAHKTTSASTAKPTESVPKPPVLESNSSKISLNIRMQYYDIMVKHCAAMYPNIADAWERAQTEELTVFKKCNTPVIYKNSAMLAINKLKKEAADSGNTPNSANKIISHEVILAGKLAQNSSWSVQKKLKTDGSLGVGEPFDNLANDKAYEMVYDLHLTEEQLVANGFPRPGLKKGAAIIHNSKPMRRPNDTERYCSRCSKVFNLNMYDEVCVDACNYHPKGTGYRRGFADNQHRCCQQPAGTPGCTYGNYHVTDYVDLNNLSGFVSTIDKDDNYVPTKKDIYALDCEMCYTTHGIELTRVTVVDINGRTVYDALVQPDNKIIDYNTVYSGITESMLKNETRTLRDIQAILMSMFHSKTVLVGHSLESDLKALKMIHSVVVDTSVLFPHKMGPPKKRALKTLCIENLKRIIQENEGGHDSAEDAEVCIQLVKFYLRNKIS